MNGLMEVTLHVAVYPQSIIFSRNDCIQKVVMVKWLRRWTLKHNILHCYGFKSCSDHMQVRFWVLGWKEICQDNVLDTGAVFV